MSYVLVVLSFLDCYIQYISYLIERLYFICAFICRNSGPPEFANGVVSLQRGFAFASSGGHFSKLMFQLGIYDTMQYIYTHTDTHAYTDTNHLCVYLKTCVRIYQVINIREILSHLDLRLRQIPFSFSFASGQISSRLQFVLDGVVTFKSPGFMKGLRTNADTMLISGPRFPPGCKDPLHLVTNNQVLPSFCFLTVFMHLYECVIFYPHFQVFQWKLPISELGLDSYNRKPKIAVI